MPFQVDDVRKSEHFTAPSVSLAQIRLLGEYSPCATSPLLGAMHRRPVAGSTQSSPPIAEIDILWITAGLGCDGDTIAMTAATQPSIEGIVMGGMPWIPKVNFHNPFLSFENGDDFLKRFHLAAEGVVDPFIL